ncbi:MAG: TRAP transporter large permease subunit [Eubacteriales bacterium]
MASVLLPVIVLIIISTGKKIPKIGGNLVVSFVAASLLALIMSGIYNPLDWVDPWLTGLHRMAFIILIMLFGAMFSKLQIESGAMLTVLNILRALFGRTPQGLVLAVLIALYMGGAMLGTVAAVGAVVGMLIVPALDDMEVPPDLICAIIVTGGSMGAIMPPISNAVNVSAGLIGVDVMSVLQLSYLTVGIGLVAVSLFFCKVYIGNKYAMPEHLLPTESAWTIFRQNWKCLIPMGVLIVLVLLASIPSVAFDLPGWLLKQIPFGESNLYATIAGIRIWGGFMNNIVLSLIISIGVSFLCSDKVRKVGVHKMGVALKEMNHLVWVQFGAAFFLGAFSVGNQMNIIAEWAGDLDTNLLKIGGSFTLMLAGMIMGSQSSSQSLLVPVLGPAWLAAGVAPVDAAMAASHIAAAGQGLPPADLNTFVIAGLVASILNKKVDPLKSMFYTVPYCAFLGGIGMLFLYI